MTINGKVVEKWKHYKLETSRFSDETVSRVENVENARADHVTAENARAKHVITERARAYENGTQERYWYNRKPLLNRGPAVFSGEELSSY